MAVQPGHSPCGDLGEGRSQSEAPLFSKYRREFREWDRNLGLSVVDAVLCDR